VCQRQQIRFVWHWCTNQNRTASPEGEPCQNIGNKATHALCALGCGQILRPVNQHVSFTRIEVLISLVQRLWHGASTRQCCLPVNSIHVSKSLHHDTASNLLTVPLKRRIFTVCPALGLSLQCVYRHGHRACAPTKQICCMSRGRCVFCLPHLLHRRSLCLSNPPPHHCERTPHHTAFLALQCVFRRGHRACVTQLLTRTCRTRTARCFQSRRLGPSHTCASSPQLQSRVHTQRGCGSSPTNQ
jgi:hypothetical protein